MSVPTTFRDLNKNGRLDPYEDPSRPIWVFAPPCTQWPIWNRATLGRLNGTFGENAELVSRLTAAYKRDHHRSAARPLRYLKTLDAGVDQHGGQNNPQPIEMPSSMAAVRAQKEDVPYDSENPLFPFGYGLAYDGS